MVREIVRQIKLNPNQIPAVPIVYRRNNMDKVSVRRRSFFYTYDIHQGSALDNCFEIREIGQSLRTNK